MGLDQDEVRWRDGWLAPDITPRDAGAGISVRDPASDNAHFAAAIDSCRIPVSMAAAKWATGAAAKWATGAAERWTTGMVAVS